MDHYNSMLASIRDVAEGINKLRDAAYKQYSALIDQVLANKITEKHKLEQIMDGLCDFCDEERFLVLYRSLCRHIYYQYPQLVGEHVAMFRTLFEGNENGNEPSKE